MRGFPGQWTFGPDELWYRSRGPAEDMTILATAFSADTRMHEPIVWTVGYGRGRVFVTMMGHDVAAMKHPAFGVVLPRGCEWAAAGAVTQPLPADFGRK